MGTPLTARVRARGSSRSHGRAGLLFRAGPAAGGGDRNRGPPRAVDGRTPRGESAVRRPPIPELLLANGLAGVALGLAVLGALLCSDVARLGELVAGSEQGPVAFLLAAVGFGSTFGSLVAGTATFLPPD